VTGDDQQLMQILRNLVTNALAYSEGPVQVRVGATQLFAVVEVADNGPGVPQESRSRIFERFYRDDTSRNRDSGGSGLGLSIVRGLSQSHGGQVGVRDNPAGGAIFWVHLPLVSAD
jgi:two-component system OmpR family sensor kinase